MRIHELSNLLANQIAAGEVIERPASVVKELVENAIDAGATQIDVIVEEAGESLIRVVDNGEGINPEDVPLAFTRHATSKISNRHDLFNIMSLGFRGEALPSIAAISDVTLNTTTQDAPSGIMYHIKGGKQVSATPANGRRGTVVSVRDLFYNTPARLKYLKRPQTELSRIADIMNRIALSYTNVAFTVTADGRNILQTNGDGNQQRVIAAIYGRDVAQKMRAITGEDDDFNITGFVSLPELTRGSRDYLTILVNGRFIKNFSVSNAVIRGYGSKLMVGRFPMGVININTDPLLVDVNVHPQKAEIRLSKEAELSALIIDTIKSCFADENLIPDAYENLYGQAQTNKIEPPAPKQVAPWAKPDMEQTIAINTGMDSNEVVINQEADLMNHAVNEFTQKYAHEPNLPIFDDEITVQVSEDISSYNKPDIPTQEELDISPKKPSGFPSLEYIGQMHGTFLFAQSSEGFYLIDQHAAQERVKYEYYRKEIGQVGTDKQRMLVPITINYSVADMLKIADKEAELEAIGLTLEPFGPTTVIVREHPTWFEKGQETETIKEMVDWILRDGNLTVAEFRERTAIMMSCKRSVRANMHLSDLQARTLLESLASTENPYNCPHGRPVVTSFTLTEMEKMFKRIQDSHEAWEEYDNHPY
ncbi:DNA mismatch repair endonuclease MutL [Leuconostoc mesenteroides]|uniref:DNA mismatch repair protein MutL n=1 Tax=Leuconostoc mesenteroides subsp. mesenteroides (strain ATCC 8293 / DSM 20343 / BCRC 11652 / CCM 1803 / JCM 6124 / NCDO 523 / NBRC 100496 / NCIMB 8023 / NCTC 12954 / NRRL B-1118 / 37Y) TaxID=203120 RepID=Q03VV5_LEUMM|nr:DNA mismatch repair endonuclease MutL [Leuconostoc mesenteroides]ABJ62667.1 DNA mismatch repair protein MutL [Leuconostoc mesenteroides subsp. mesenteroides ATCC 8293]MCT3042465.1 DNA mismatch repair endonuclease MutL [Leuconostoc mesenteroides]MCU4664352.1 DNA mismatch repair endonuclease MutL [Leuconostoc mesenteroides]MDG9747486.1 DNA mismatch repair endonuclease MutL [Leuconostoc mesenteroides]QHM55439.1 DNA mismatch repair protein MutL [Leuconostoc mesenteroides]